MQDFLIEVFRKFTTPEKPCLREAELYTFVKKHVAHLMRRNGQCYDANKDDIDKTISGTLFGSKFFEKDLTHGTWSINFAKAEIWQKAMLECIDQKQPWVMREMGGDQAQVSTSMSYLNKVQIYNKKPPPTKRNQSLPYMASGEKLPPVNSVQQMHTSLTT
jgi:hypothetical protein